MTAPNVVGLDLSITATGVCDRRGDVSTIRGASKLGDLRLTTLYDQVRHLCATADLAVIEDLPTHAHGAGITGMVHGAVRVALMHSNVEYVLVPPASLKKYATGKGNAGKPDMAVALYKRAGLELRDDNQVDAWWLRAMGLHGLGRPLFDLPASQTGALAKVDWSHIAIERQDAA